MRIVGSFLAYWRIDGDSLHFLKLHRRPFVQGLGWVGVGSDYVIDADSSVYFVLDGSGGDAGFVVSRGTLVRLDKNLELDELRYWTFGTDIDREDHTHMTYAFLKGVSRPELQLVEQHFKWIYDPKKYGVIIDSVFVRTDTTLIDLGVKPDPP